MIKKISFTILSILLLTVSVMYLQSCDIKSPTENVNVLFNTDGPTTGASVSFIDARTSQLINSANFSTNVTVKFVGTNAGKITDLAKNPTTTFTSSNGIISFGVVEGTTLPLTDVSVLISANGFLTTSFPITITSQGYSAFNMYAVNIANPPDGVSIAQYGNAGTCTNGVLNSESVLTTTLTNGTGGVAKIRLPAGTIITDNSPSPINMEGRLGATIAYFDPTKETALRCFPGGFNINDTAMFSAGFALFDIYDASGRTAKKFPGIQPEITIEIPSNAVNLSGGTIQLGEAIPVFSYETSTGKWSHEQIGVVSEGSNSNKAIKFNTAHLSYWNLDYLNGANCYQSRKIIFNQTGGCSQVPLQIKLYFVNGSTETYYKTIVKAASDNNLTFYYAPSANVKMKFYYNGNLVYTSDVISLCSGGDLTCTYNIPTLQAITGTVTGICVNNPNVVVRPSFPVYYKRSGTTAWYYLGYMVEGSLTQYCGEFGTYDFMTYYNGTAIFANNISITTVNPSFSFTLNCN